MKIDDVRKMSQFDFPQTAEDQERIRSALRAMGIDPSELYQELEMSNRFINTHRDTTYTDAMISLHSHNYYEIIFCRTAGVDYLVGSERYRLQAGDIVFVPPGLSHRPILPETLTEPYVRDVIWVSPQFMDWLFHTFPGSNIENYAMLGPIRTAGTRWEFLGDIFQNGVLEEERKQHGWEVAVIGNTMTILANIARIHTQKSGATMKAEHPELLDRITAYIEQNYAGHITISDLSKQFYVSESSVSHLFKQRMGVSIYRYITQRRLIAAKTLIHRKLPLEDVAHMVGFVDYSTFYRAFKQEFGISPRKFGQL